MDQYKKFFVQVRFDIEYYQLMLSHYTTIARIINLVLGVISCGSLASLFAFPGAQKILAIILALTQVISAAKPYLPYESRVVELNRILIKFDTLFLDIESDWNKGNLEGNPGKLTDKEWIDKLTGYKKRKAELQQDCMPNDDLPNNKRMSRHAGELADRYFESTYGEGF